MTSVLLCPICDVEVHRHSDGDYRPPEVVAHEAEIAAEDHLRQHHALRFAIWRLTKWDRALKGWML